MKQKPIKAWAVVENSKTNKVASLVANCNKEVAVGYSIFSRKSEAIKRKNWIYYRKDYKVIPVLITPIIKKK